jgi:hypothetical protein
MISWGIISPGYQLPGRHEEHLPESQKKTPPQAGKATQVPYLRVHEGGGENPKPNLRLLKNNQEKVK